MGDSQSWKARGNLSPRDSILHETVSRLQAANHVFLGSWTVDICQEGRSLRSAPQRRHVAHLRRRSCGTPRKLSGQDWEVSKTTALLGQCAPQAPGHLSCSELGSHKTHAQPTETEPEVCASCGGTGQQWTAAGTPGAKVLQGCAISSLGGGCY